MRESTATGINNPLLPRDCSCGEFAGGAVRGRDLFFGCLSDFRKRYIGRALFFLAFVGNLSVELYWKSPLFPGIRVDLPMVLYRKRPLFPGICGIRHFWHWHLWHLAHSIPERASCGTECACRAQNSLLGYAARFLRHSVRETAFYGTEWIFGSQNSLLWYATRSGGTSANLSHLNQEIQGQLYGGGEYVLIFVQVHGCSNLIC